MKKISILAGIFFSGVLLALLFFRIDFSRFILAFYSVDYGYVLPIILIVYFGCYLRALRWRWIMKPIKDVPAGSLFPAIVIGYMANSLLPARMGEFIRAHVIGRREGISRAASFATIVVERLFDGLSILVILVAVLCWISIPVKGALLAAGGSALLLYVFVIAVVLAGNYKRDLVFRMLRIIFCFLPEAYQQKMLRVIESLAEGFEIVERGHHLFVIAVYSFLIWLITAAGIYAMAIAFGYHLPYSAAVFILVLLTFAVMLPSAPGFMGTFHAGMVYGLMVFGVPREVALSMAVLYHGLGLLPIVLLGLYYLWKEKISLV